MNRSLSFFTICAVLCAAGCGKNENSAAGNTPPPPAAEKSIAMRNEGRDREPGEGQAPPVAAKTPVPAELQTEGYSYYGLSNSNPVTLKIVGEPDGRSGAMVTEFAGVEGGKAKFRRSWGELGLPETEIVSDKTGVYVTSYAGVKLPKPAMEIPASLKKGAAWKVNATFDLPGAGKVVQTGNDVVIGPESITVGGKKYDAILVEEKGTVESSQGKQKIVGRQWFVKDIGPVRQVIVSEANGKSQTKTIEIGK